MKNRRRIKKLLNATEAMDNVCVAGWVRTRRDSKAFSFIEVNDGSSLKGIQVIIDADVPAYGSLEGVTTGASVVVEGKLVESKGKGQRWEVVAEAMTLVGRADTSYPLQKKGHSLEFLREISHLRPRSNLFGAVFRTRNRLAFAVHQFFQGKGFNYIHTPIVTASDCEGAGELFRVTTIDPEDPPRGENKKVDYTRDFFGKPTYLTVSGQLEVEVFACSMSDVYTFGPTFRAENSHTSRHASEFWMIEPEMAFCDLHGNMDLAEEFIKYLITDVLENCSDDLDFFGKFVDKGLRERLQFVVERPFKRVTYEEAVAVLKESGRQFEFTVEYGENLQSEHERYLTEVHFKQPVTLYNYPDTIKPFYMRRNDDGRTVAAMDVLVPGIGEIVGGSQREERLEVLRKNMEHHGLPEEDYWWYLELRKFGTVPHSGFGLGFERMLMFVTGVGNIRDVIPFARTPGSADF